MARPRRKPEELRDWGTRELRQHHIVVIEGDRESRMGGRPDPHARVADQRPLDRYALRRLLCPKDSDLNRLMYLAGQRLREDWELAGLEPKVVANMDGTQGGREEFSARQLDAKRRKDVALRDVGPVLTPVLVHVVCTDGLAGEWARRRGWHEKMGLGALRLALDALVRHYRL